MNNYARLNDLKEELQGAGSGTSNDAVLLRWGERASRWVDQQTQRHFYSQIATRVYHLDSRGISRDLSQFEIPDDLISVTSLKVDEDGDATYETTLVVNTDYWLHPYNPVANTPYTRIDLNTTGALGSWPTTRRTIEVAGMFGYSNETESVGTIAAAVATASVTTVTMTVGHTVSAGDTLVLGTEQLDVTAVATNTLTVVRGINGTTAATHLINAAARRRRFPRDIEAITVMQAARFFRETQTGYSGSVGNSEFGGYQFNTMYPAIRDVTQRYQRYPIGVA